MGTSALTKTFGSASSASDRYKFTFSTWFKRGLYGSGNDYYLFGHQSSDGASDFAIRIDSDALRLYDYQSSSYNIQKVTNRLFRDVNAWYHIVIKIDTTQATSTDRVKIYVNGSEETSFSTNTDPSQNQSIYAFSNTGQPTVVGGRYTSSLTAGYYWDGSLAHTHCIIGYAYDASAFGETDATTGIWKPKTAPSVTYGTNGFFLKFENSGSMGTDSSPNGNNFTVNGTLTQTVDTPSNVFATMNPLHSSNTTFSNGNTKVVGASSGNPIPTSTLAVSKGKWYWETKMKGSYFNVGIMRVDQNLLTLGIGYGSAGWVYAIDGNIYHNGSQLLQTGTTISVNDIVGFYLDLDNGTLKLQKNGSNVYSGNAVITSIPLTDFYYIQCNSYDFNNEFNFGNGYFGTTAVSSANNDVGGQGIFEYSPTLSGVNYYALNTKNINTYG